MQLSGHCEAEVIRLPLQMIPDTANPVIRPPFSKICITFHANTENS